MQAIFSMSEMLRLLLLLELCFSRDLTCKIMSVVVVGVMMLLVLVLCCFVCPKAKPSHPPSKHSTWKSSSQNSITFLPNACSVNAQSLPASTSLSDWGRPCRKSSSCIAVVGGMLLLVLVLCCLPLCYCIGVCVLFLVLLFCC